VDLFDFVIGNLFTTARSRILIELRNRPYTVSELSKITGYSKPTLSYHLDKLCEAGFVQRIDDGRKWVYYKITEKGMKAIRYELAKTAILLAGGLVSIVSGVLGLIIEKLSVRKAVETTETPVPVPTTEPTSTKTPVPVPIRTPTPKEIGYTIKQVQMPDVFSEISLLFIVLGILLLTAYTYLKLKK